MYERINFDKSLKRVADDFDGRITWAGVSDNNVKFRVTVWDNTNEMPQPGRSFYMRREGATETESVSIYRDRH